MNNERTTYIILKLQVCCATPFTNNNPDKTNYPDLISGISDSQPVTQNPWDRDRNENENKPLTRKPTPTNVNADSPPDIRGHRNLELLPKKCGQFSDDFRIWGGNRTYLFEMPWMVLIAYDSRKYLLTRWNTNIVVTKHLISIYFIIQTYRVYNM